MSRIHNVITTQQGNHMQWWANEPLVFARAGDLESNRVRLLIAEKRAGCAVRVLRIDEPVPEFLEQLNPDGIYPFLVCKDLVCYGHALDELLHERYPAPQLLPNEPVYRAQMRLLAEQVSSWYRQSPLQQRAHLDELAAHFNPHLPFYASHAISVLDVAIAALLFDCVRIQYRFEAGAPFTGYARMMVLRPSFDVLERPQIVCAPIRPSSTRLEGAA